MTIKDIKADLREIQYYYAHEKEFADATKIIGQSSILEKVERYNAAVCGAPPRLYDVYRMLYIYYNTQIVVADDLDCSVAHVKRLNRQLCDFLLNKFTGEGNAESRI